MAERPLWPVVLCCALAVGCGEAPARGQVVVHVDTDMPLLSQIDDNTSGDAAIDSLRVEVLDQDLTVLDARVLSLYSAADLPLSFGIPSDATTSGQVVVRLRGFRALFSVPGELLGAPVLDPRAEVTVDRLVSIELPADGVQARAVTLRGDCIGAPVRFGLDGDNRSCIDAERLDSPASEGVSDAAPKTSLMGTWARAKVKPCLGEPPPGTRCVPGGLMVLGDPLFFGRIDFEYDSVPLRVVEVSPFFLDETELTVGALRAMVEAGYAGSLPQGKLADADCTWDPSSPGTLAVNCVDYDVADSVCADRGGLVTSEAQWEHAARGRGKRWLYPWGDESPECCSASLGQASVSDCPKGDLEPVGSHQGSPACPGDVSRDGILDLAGGLAELMRDSVAHSFAEPCWESPEAAPRILVDPVCFGATTRMSRGAAWWWPFGSAPLPIRRGNLQNQPSHGFRCAFAN